MRGRSDAIFAADILINFIGGRWLDGIVRVGTAFRMGSLRAWVRGGRALQRSSASK